MTLAQEGTRVYQDTFDLLCRREASQPNEICEADRTALDLWTVTTPASHPGHG
jgi:hypothetical protein